MSRSRAGSLLLPDVHSGIREQPGGRRSSEPDVRTVQAMKAAIAAAIAAVEAANNIQRVFRGMLARKHVKENKEHKAATKIQARFR